MENLFFGHLKDVDYEHFIIYFENDYIKELAVKEDYTERKRFLDAAKQIAQNHKWIYEHRHGYGSYAVNLAKYGSLKRTPLQIINGDSYVTSRMSKRRTSFDNFFSRTKLNLQRPQVH